jgi:hypothetical protein
MKRISLVAALLLLAGCSAGGTEITTLSQANKAIEKAGFDCQNPSQGTMDSIAWIECETEGIDGFVTLGFAPTKELFLSSWVEPCGNADPSVEETILVGDTWVVVLSDEQAIFQNLDEAQKALGGKVQTVSEFCASIK